jgi:hypothetical protein
MDEISLEIMAIVLVGGFIAAFVDSVVGGGGLISIPVLMLTGIPVVECLGTNKVAASMGALFSMGVFIKSGKADLGLVKRMFFLSFFGSVAGVFAVQQVPPDFLKPLVIVLLIGVALYSILKKDWGDTSTYSGMKGQKLLLAGIVALALGFYDGFFGPGTGSFLLFGFLMLGFDFVTAAGNARSLNFASNIAAAIFFSLSGLVNFYYAVPMGIIMIIGAYLGSRMAIKKGASYVRPLFISVTALLIGKQIYDMLK